MQEARYQKDKKFFIEKVESLGGKVLFDEANNDGNLQLQKVENMLAKGIDVLVIQPCNADAAATFVEMAHKDNVPVISYDRLIGNCDLDFYLTQDSFKVGVVQAEYMVDWLKKEKGAVKGNIIICMGQAGHSVANEITRGNMSIIDKYPDLKVVVKQNHSAWAPEQALETVTNALTKYKNDIQAVLCNNSGMARGVVTASNEAGLKGKIFIAGSDADLQNCKMIVAGEQSMDVLKGIIPLAQKSAEVAMKLAKGQTIKADIKMNNGFKDVDVIVTPIDPFNKGNLDKIIINRAGGLPSYHTQADVYGK